MDFYKYLFTCLAEKENVSIVVPIQLLHYSHDLLEEMNFPPFHIHDRILQAVDENHLKNVLMLYYPNFN